MLNLSNKPHDSNVDGNQPKVLTERNFVRLQSDLISTAGITPHPSGMIQSANNTAYPRLVKICTVSVLSGIIRMCCMLYLAGAIFLLIKGF